MEPKSKEEILQTRKEIEEELVEMLKEVESEFTLEDIKEIIYNEEDQDDMMKVVSIFDQGGDISDLSNILETVTDAWNYFHTKP